MPVVVVIVLQTSVPMAMLDKVIAAFHKSLVLVGEVPVEMIDPRQCPVAVRLGVDLVSVVVAMALQTSVPVVLTMLDKVIVAFHKSLLLVGELLVEMIDPRQSPVVVRLEVDLVPVVVPSVL